MSDDEWNVWGRTEGQGQEWDVIMRGVITDPPPVPYWRSPIYPTNLTYHTPSAVGHLIPLGIDILSTLRRPWDRFSEDMRRVTRLLAETTELVGRETWRILNRGGAIALSNPLVRNARPD